MIQLLFKIFLISIFKIQESNLSNLMESLQISVFFSHFLQVFQLNIFNIGLQETNWIKIIYQTLKKDNQLSKNVALLSYKSLQDLQKYFQSYFTYKDGFPYFGVIRIALNIDFTLRNKQKNKYSNPNSLKAYLETYGKNGVHSDLDHFQSLKQLLQQFHIQWSSCSQIHKNQITKEFKRNILLINNYLGGSRAKISLFLDQIFCQSFKSFKKQYNSAHQILMNFGFQSSTLNFLTQQNSLQVNQKIARLSYSFIKEYSLQQDHLHSSKTYYYPISSFNYIPITGTLYGGLLILLVGLTNLIGFLAQNPQKIKSHSTIINLIEMVLFGIQYKITQDLNYTITYLLFKMIIKLVYNVLSLKNSLKIKSKQNLESSQISMQYLGLIAIQSNNFLLNLSFQFYIHFI